MTDEEKKAIERIEKKILTEECKKVIGVPIYISDLKTILNLIQKQQAEIEKKDKIIDLMAEHIASSAVVDDTVCMYIECNKDTCKTDDAVKCTKQYFEKKVEE